MRRVALLLALGLLCVVGRAEARDKCPPPVVIPGVKGNATTTKFGNGYITRSSDGTSYTTSKFGSGWITRSSDGKSYTTTKFGDGAIHPRQWAASDNEPFRLGHDQPFLGRNHHDDAPIRRRNDQQQHNRSWRNHVEVRKRLHLARNG